MNRDDALRSREAKGRLSIAYLLAPCVAIAPAVPAILSLRVGQVPWWISNLPFWIGLASAPGYVYAWTERWRGRSIGHALATWIYVSLAGSVLASAWGAVLLSPTIIFSILPAICAVLSVHLWQVFAKRGA